ncbi:MAG: family 43 glycosylhydrolase [Propionicimonas sp.]|uniref:glycoside hydrolase family 43 protein n=1 Tax=Propionicimonas sp. TaxID=1955623 RepID=UPI003D0E962D
MTTVADGVPVIAGFHPDPTICRVGEEYYLANSSFEYFPGAPLWRSSDLASWSPVGNILTRRSQFPVGDGRDSGGIFGSTLRHHDGRFWFVTTNMSAFGRGHLIVSTDDPAGEWSEPVHTAGAIGIDPDLAWGPDGECYLTWCSFPHGGAIAQARIDPGTGSLLEEPRVVWTGTGLAYPEGPHLYRRGAYWYLVIAEGGTERGHAVSVARAPHPTGPFTSAPGNPVFSHRSLAHAVQNVGHADLVERPDGSWAAVYLGVRPQGTTPGYTPLGRETFLADVDWVDDWPRFRPSEPAGSPAAGFTDDFAAPCLDPRWVAPAGEPARFATAGPVGLALSGEAGHDHRSLLCTRVRHQAWRAEARFDLAAGAGRLVLRLDSRHWYAVEADGDSVRVVTRVGPFTSVVAEAPVAASALALVLAAEPPAGAGSLGANLGPDDIVLGYRDGEATAELARLDGRYLTTEVAGGFTGRMVGIGARDGSALLRSFHYEPIDPGHE